MRRNADRVSRIESARSSSNDLGGLVLIGVDGARCNDRVLLSRQGESDEEFFGRVQDEWPGPKVLVPAKDGQSIRNTNNDNIKENDNV